MGSMSFTLCDINLCFSSIVDANVTNFQTYDQSKVQLVPLTQTFQNVIIPVSHINWDEDTILYLHNLSDTIGPT